MSAFTAWGLQYIPNSRDIRFPTAHFNEGNDYNGTSGVFTCRIPGIYLFTVNLMKYYQTSDYDCYIMLNGSFKVRIYIAASSSSYANGVGSYETATSSEVFKLKQGDRVQVGLCGQSHDLAVSDVDAINTFSGVLIKANL